MTPALLDGIEKALAYAGDTHTVGEVLSMVANGQAQMWVAENALIVTEVHTYPRHQAVHFWLAAGELDAVIELSHEVLRQAKDAGITRATLMGRKGWVRALADEGWKPSKLVAMEKELADV